MDTQVIYIMLLLVITVICIGISAGVKYDKDYNNHIVTNDTHDKAISKQAQQNSQQQLQTKSPEMAQVQGNYVGSATTTPGSAPPPTSHINSNNIIQVDDGSLSVDDFNSYHGVSNYYLDFPATGLEFSANLNTSGQQSTDHDTFIIYNANLYANVVHVGFKQCYYNDGDGEITLNDSDLAIKISNSGLLTIGNGTSFLTYNTGTNKYTLKTLDTFKKITQSSTAYSNSLTIPYLVQDINNMNEGTRLFSTSTVSIPQYTKLLNIAYGMIISDQTPTPTYSLFDFGFAPTSYPPGYTGTIVNNDTDETNQTYFNALTGLQQYPNRYTDLGMFAILQKTPAIGDPDEEPSAANSVTTITATGFRSGLTEDINYTIIAYDESKINSSSPKSISNHLTSLPSGLGSNSIYYMIYTIDVTSMDGTYILTDGNNLERSQIVLVFLQNVKDNYGFTVTQRPVISTDSKTKSYTSTTIGGAKIYDNFTSNYDIGFFPMYINNNNITSGSSITIKVDSGKITSANVQGEVYYYSNTETGVVLQNNNVYYKGNADDSNYNQYTANTVNGSELSDITYS